MFFGKPASTFPENAPSLKPCDFVAIRHGVRMARRPSHDARTAAEKAFKAVTTKPVEAPPLPPRPPTLPGAKETVSLRIDRDVLDFFQDGGPGWQERINAALRKAAGK